jgi:hypothetical protein
VLLPGVFSSLTRIQFTYLPLHTVAYSQTIIILPSKLLCSAAYINHFLEPRVEQYQLLYHHHLNSTTHHKTPPQTNLPSKKPSTTMPSTSNPFSHLTRTSSATSSDTNSINTTSSISSTSSWTSLLQKSNPVSTYSTINNTSTTEPSQHNKTTLSPGLSPGEKQKIRQQDRMSMQTLAMHAAMR